MRLSSAPGWLHDLEYALEWACELLQLSPPPKE